MFLVLFSRADESSSGRIVFLLLGGRIVVFLLSGRYVFGWADESSSGRIVAGRIVVRTNRTAAVFFG